MPLLGRMSVIVLLLGLGTACAGGRSELVRPLPAAPATAPQPTATPEPDVTRDDAGLQVPPLFAADSVWRRPLPDDAGGAGAQDELALRVARQARYTRTSEPVQGKFGAGFTVNVNEQEYSVPIWTVPRDQPRVPVELVDGRGAPRPPGWVHGLPEALSDVPLPTDVGRLAAEGLDKHVAVWQPSTDTYWEFWVFEQVGSGGSARYTARYGGRIDGVSRSDGVLPHTWGARATSLALAGGVLRMHEYERGEVDHALAVGLPVVSAGFVPPATRGDGPGAVVGGGPAERDAVPEGARFRLPAGYDCVQGLPEDATRLVRLVCEAARDHGLVVVDRTGGTVSFYAEDDRTVGTPYSAVSTSPWPQVSLGDPRSGLDDFPWDDLRTVPPAG